MQLTIESLGCERGGRTIIDGLSLTAAAGEAVLLTGPNGAGKTTLLRTIAGFLPPAAGTMRLTDVPEGEPVAEHCHYIGHLNAVKPRLSVEENLAFWRDFLGDSQREAGHGSPEGIIDAALDRLGLLHLAATAWILAFGGFAVAYWPVLTGVAAGLKPSSPPPGRPR